MSVSCSARNSSGAEQRLLHHVPPAALRQALQTQRGGVVVGRGGRSSGAVESLPVFRFGTLRGEKEGLECVVCLGRFDPSEALRLPPKCRHGFHVECVDTWLDAHSTCPHEDVLLLSEPPKPSTTGPAGAVAAVTKEFHLVFLHNFFRFFYFSEIFEFEFQISVILKIGSGRIWTIFGFF
jgi:hypothetical protein